MQDLKAVTRSLQPRVWVALPTYNERDNLRPLIAALFDAVPSARVLVVDDNSPDGTGQLADELAANDDRVQVLHRPGKEGLGAAYRAAFAYLLNRPDCDVIVQIDCDFSHDPADVARLLAAIGSGADLVLGSRYIPGGGTPGWSLARRAISRGGSLFARTVLQLPAHDLTGGFKAWRADLLRRIDLQRVGTQGYGFQIEMTWWARRSGASIREIPIIFSERRAGQSKMSRKIIAEALLMVLKLRLAGLRGSPPSAGSPVSETLSGLMSGAGSVTLDDLGAISVVGADHPARRRLPAHRTGETEPRS
jgi:dolichol-phosphate mannosyltransferase